MKTILKSFLAILPLLLALGAIPSAAEPVITCPDAVPGQANQWIAFRRDVKVDSRLRSAVARIAADSKYWLWINGKEVVFEGSLKRGPNPEGSYFDEVDLAPYLRKGENKIALLLWYFGRQGFSHKDSGQAQLMFECPEAGITGTEGWMCRIHPAYGTADCPKPNFRLPESSISFDARKDIGGWQTGATEGFVPAVAAESALGELRLRPIPMWKDFGVRSAPFKTLQGESCDTLVALLPHNMQMTPVITVTDSLGGHRILIETDHSAIGSTENLRAEYITAPGTTRYESLGWLSGLRIILTVPHGVTVEDVSYRETGYDTFPEGRFSCSDPFFNRMWEKALRTIYVNVRDTFFDCPERERAQWWGDLVVIMGECFYTYSTSLHPIFKKGILELCEWQKSDSSLFSPVPAGNWGKELPVQMLAAVGKYGIWTYYMHTGDLETVRAAYPAVKRYLDVYTIGPDGLLDYRKTAWNWGDWGQNRDQRLLQATWYCLALEGAANMASVLGLTDDESDFRSRLEAQKEACNRVAWTGKAYHHPGYEGETDDRVQALAVLAGIPGPEKYDALYEVFRTEEHASSFMEKYVMEALFAIGHGDYALERARRRYDFMVNHPDFDTLFESWEVGVKDWRCGSVNHAWSGGALAVIPSNLMGINPLEPGWKVFCVKPCPGLLSECTLRVPTVRGIAESSFKVRKGRVKWVVRVPEGSHAVVTVPWEYKSCRVGLRRCKTNEVTLGPGVHTFRIKLLSCDNF